MLTGSRNLAGDELWQRPEFGWEGRRSYGARQGPVLDAFGSWELGEHGDTLKNGRGRLWPRQRHGTVAASSAVVGGWG